MKKRILALALVIAMILTVLPMALAAEPYSDVAPGAWYYENVQYVSRNGLMNGTAEGVFSPNATATRAMVLTILARTAGVETAYSNPWYADSLYWAVANGISDGSDPMGNITREQVAALLYRYATLLGCDMSYRQSLNIFTDAANVSDWAVDGLEWAVAVGLFEGTDNQLMPKTNITRAQLAAVLNRYCEKVLNFEDVGGKSGGAAGALIWYYLVTAPVDTPDELVEAIAKGGEIKLEADIVLDDGVILQIPAGVEVVLDLNGKTITGSSHKNVGHVIENKGSLVLKNGTVSSTAANGGSAVSNKGVMTIEDAVLNGAPNADGSWPSYTINNTGTLTINNSLITSCHGAVASYGEGAIVTLNNTDIKMSGIPGFTSHGIYTYNAGKAVVNGGIIQNLAEDQAATGGSVINGDVTVTAGTFSGRIEAYYGTPSIQGGTFDVDPSSYRPDTTKYKVVANEDGTWTVVPRIVEEGAVYDVDSNGDMYLYNVPSDYAEPIIEVAEGTTTIGGYAFAYNTNIETIILPSTVTTLNDRAFRDTSASTVVLNEGLTNISYQAFRNAANVTSVEIPSTVTTISKEAFQNSGIKELTLPATVTTLEYGACRDMKEVETVTIAGNVEIPVYAFRACTKLTTVYLLGDDVTFAGKGMIFTNKENGDGSAITIYVKNETVRDRLLENDTAATDYGGYTIVVDPTIGG